jgi:hypothetical protein
MIGRLEKTMRLVVWMVASIALVATAGADSSAIATS